MSLLLRLGLASLIALISVLGSATAATEVYLSLRAANGGDALVDRVQILSFSKGTETKINTGSGSTPGNAGRSLPKSAKLGFTPNAAVSEMFKGVTTGRPYQLLITLERPGTDTERARALTEVAFNKVLFSSLQCSAADGQDLVEVEVEFLYDELYWTDYRLASDGTNREFDTIGWSHALDTEVFTNFFEGPGPGGGGGGGGGGSGGSGDLDTDDDGMPDAWEDANALNKNSDADADENDDGDQLTNFQEFVAGTDPQSASSFFRCQINLHDGSINLRWDSLTDRRYRIMHAADPANGFQLLEEIDASAGSSTSYTPAPNTGPFFRINAILAE